MQTAPVLPDTISTQVAVGASRRGWKHLRSPLLGFVPPHRELLHSSEHLHSCAAKALAISPAQIPENMIFHLRRSPPCISESVLAVVLRAHGAGVFLQTSSELRALPPVSLPRMAALAGQGC